MIAATPPLAVAASFAGLSEADDIAAGVGSIEPPDPWVAVNSDFVIESVNSVVRIVDRAGKAVQTRTVESFFTVLPNQVNVADPRIIFDQRHARWIGTVLSYDCTNGYLYFAVSDSADPTGSWTGWYFTYAGQVPDYPGLGSSDDKIVLSANEYPIDPFAMNCISPVASGGSVLVVDWASATSGTLTSGRYFFNAGYLSWRPAPNLSPDPIMHLVGQRVADSHVTYAEITGDVFNPNAPGPDPSPVQFIGLTDMASIAPFDPAPPPSQPGSPATIVDAVSGRPTDAVWSNGSLWFVSTYPLVPSGDTVVRDTVRITELTTTGTPAVRQDFAISNAGFDTFMGGIGLAHDGTAYFVYSKSSSTDYVATWANVQRPGDALNTASDPILVAPGGGPYPGDRWGDYVGVATDPACPYGVWVGDEVPTSGGAWTTVISALSIVSPATSPCAPTGVTAVPGNGRVRVSWRTPTSDGGSPITAYTVTSTPEGKTCSTTGALTCLVTGLTNGQPYAFTATAANASGIGQASAPSGATPLPAITRLAGPDRFSTAAAISTATFSPGVDVAYIAYAFGFPDALAGAAAAGTIHGPVLLAATTGALNAATAAELTRLKPNRIVVLGGTGVISDAVKGALATYVGP